MNIAIPLMILIAIMIVVIGVFAYNKNKQYKEIRQKNPGYPESYWQGQGLGIGIAIGAGVGVAMGNIAIGIAIGVAIGAAIGANLEKQHKDEIRPITDEEKELQRQTNIFSIGILLAGIVVFAVIFFLAR